MPITKARPKSARAWLLAVTLVAVTLIVAGVVHALTFRVIVAGMVMLRMGLHERDLLLRRATFIGATRFVVLTSGSAEFFG